MTAPLRSTGLQGHADHRQARPPRPQRRLPARHRGRLGRRGRSPGKFVITIMAAVAELEAGLTSARTKAALQAAKARGVKLGNPRLRVGTGEMAEMPRAALRRQARRLPVPVRSRPWLHQRLREAQHACCLTQRARISEVSEQLRIADRQIPLTQIAKW
jgi:hypothetical protein